MSRFTSLEYAKSETRSTLRDRFGRNLPAAAHVSRRFRAEEGGLPDEKLLKLLLGLRIEFSSDSEIVREAYEALRRQHRDAPLYGELIESGWIRETWGRMRAGRDSSRELQHASPEIQAVLGPILSRRYGRRMSCSDEVKDDPVLVGTVSKLTDASENVYRLYSYRPEWVSTRLWECLSDQFADARVRLRLWVDRWELIDSPLFVISTTWDSETAKSFCDTALDSIASDPGLFDWFQARDFLVKRIARASERSRDEIETYVPMIPSTLVDRFLWLEHEFERLGFEIYQESEELHGLVNLLLYDSARQNQSPAPHPIADFLFRLSGERPELLMFIVATIRREPVLFADLLLNPGTSVLACLLIGEWASNPGAWDRELVERDNSAARIVAFADAVSVAAHFLKESPSLAGEIASLLSWMYKAAKRSRLVVPKDNVDEMFRIFRHELLAQQTSEVLLEIVANLVQTLPEDGLGVPQFVAALDVVATGGLADTVDPKPFIVAYIQTIRRGDYVLAEVNIDTLGALSLVQLAARSGPDSWNDFLVPINIRSLVLSAFAEGDNQFMHFDEIIRGIRAHVRVLSRAVSGWGEKIPDEMLEALANTIRSGAIAHAEKGRVAAFAARWEEDIFGGRNRPIAVDLGEALCALAGDSRANILTAILEIDEPLTLAQLLPVAPPATRESIQLRISSLTPREAGQVQTLPEIQARIDMLLSVGALDAAKSFMDYEGNLKTLGKAAGREVRRLQSELRLHLLQGNFDAILAAKPPDGLGPTDIEAINDSLAFYKALAETSRPGGNLHSAEQAFLRLSRSRTHVAAYVVNLLAARVSVLLSGDLFGRVRTPDQQRARSFLGEADSAFGRIRDISDEDRAIYDCNRSLLLLAIGQPRRAYEILQSTPRSMEIERTSVYSAVALSRMGRNAEALETLHRTEGVFGNTELLRAARGQIERGTPFSDHANVSVSTSEDAVPGFNSELAQQAESRASSVRIGIITALPLEGAAVLAMLDEPIRDVRKRSSRVRVYEIGYCQGLDSRHSVIHLCMGEMGNNAAAARVAEMMADYPKVELIIMVGIAGGVPNPSSPSDHVRLGDIVVTDRFGVVQYDFGKHDRNGFVLRNRSVPPAAQLLQAATRVAVAAESGDRRWVQYLTRRPVGGTYDRPDSSTDLLYATNDPDRVLTHPDDPQRVAEEPRVFWGPIASSNGLLKDPVMRDMLRDSQRVKAVEMEGSGIADASWEGGLGYMAIRGICDYCDAHKSDAWQRYAAVAAAAYFRCLLAELPALA